jgi:polyhydroxyalkanoate synthesis repressor PhaR
METVMETSGTGEKPRRVIKRYSNRKLYDTKDSRYVTLQQIGEMVRAGEEVQIIDNATKEDKTEVTLALIISEDLKSQPRSVPLGTLRDLIQERGERLLSQLREGPIGRLIPGVDGVVPPGTAGTGGAAPPPAPEPVAVAAASTADGDKPKGSLRDIVDVSRHTLDQWQQQWQQAMDERLVAILPGVGLFRELKDEVRRLTQRVDELEAKLGTGPAPAGDASGNESLKKE